MITRTRVLNGVSGLGFESFAFKKKPKLYPGQRECGEPGCITVLSQYNRHDRCWLHSEGAPVKVHVGRRANA